MRLGGGGLPIVESRPAHMDAMGLAPKNGACTVVSWAVGGMEDRLDGRWAVGCGGGGSRCRGLACYGATYEGPVVVDDVQV